MIHIATHAETVSNTILSILRVTLSKIKSLSLAFQKLMEASAYSRILSEHGDKLTQEQREQVRQNLIALMKK